MVVLGFISNERKRFHVFVSIRVQKIHDSTLRKQLRYVESEQNPADEASRGMKANGLPDSPPILGPEFLWSERTKWFECDEQEQTLRKDDPEVTKISRYGYTIIKPKKIYSRVNRFLNWHRALRAVLISVKYINQLKKRIKKEPSEAGKNFS